MFAQAAMLRHGLRFGRMSKNIILILAAALSGWTVRGYIADAEIATLQLEQANYQKSVYEQIVIYGKSLADELQRNDEISAELKNERIKKNRIIEKEVIRYVEKTDGDNSCVLSANWVQLHNAAASNSVPTASDTSGVNATAASTGRALETITDNYISCNDTRHQLLDLQQFIRPIYEQARP